MSRIHYSQADLAESLDHIGLKKGANVFCHSNVGLFGRMDGPPQADEICEIYFDTIMEKIGSDGTLIVPTYTYSFPRNQPFDPDHSETQMGIFAEWIRKHPDSKRLCDPSYSHNAIGKKAEHFTQGCIENSFGENSGFYRLHKTADTLILNCNHPGCTFIHYAERSLGVPYRFDKTFPGTLIVDGVERDATNTIWVRYLSDDALAHSPIAFGALMKSSGRMKYQQLGRGEIACFQAQDAYDLIAEILEDRPWFLTEAERLGVTDPVIIPE